jgi:uncharacterized membrane protein
MPPISPRTMTLLAFAGIVIGATLLLRVFRVGERIRGLSPKAGQRLLAILWVGALSLITAVLLFAPTSAENGQPNLVKGIVIAICWLIALFAFTPWGSRLRDRKLLPESIARIVTVILFFLFVAVVVVTAVVAGGGVIVGVIVAASVIPIGWHAIRDHRRKAKRGSRRQRKKEPADAPGTGGN